MKSFSKQLNFEFFVKIFVFFFFAWFFYEIRFVMLIILFSFILSSGLRPFISKLETKRIPRSVSVAFLTLAMYLTLFGITFLLINVLTQQIYEFLNTIPQALTSVDDSLPGNIKINGNSLSNELGSFIEGSLTDVEGTIGNLSVIGNTGLKFANSVIGGGIYLFAITVITMYMSLRKENVLISFFSFLIGKRNLKYVKTIERIEKVLSEWLVGQFALVTIVGVLSYFALLLPYLFGVDDYKLGSFALLIGVVAAILDFFPGIGPTITLVLTTILSLFLGDPLSLVVYIAFAFTVIQNLEAIVLAPKIMSKVTNLDPIITICAIIIGAQVGGVIGALASVPISLLFKEVYTEMFRGRFFKLS